MTDAPPAGVRRHRFLEASIDLPANLTEAQLDGRECIRCGHEAEIGEAVWEHIVECASTSSVRCLRSDR